MVDSPRRRALHISQPTVATQVGALEANYGVELFLRRGRSVVLTDVGRTLFAMAQRVFAQEEEALNFLRESRELRTGKPLIGAVGPFHRARLRGCRFPSRCAPAPGRRETRLPMPFGSCSEFEFVDDPSLSTLAIAGADVRAHAHVACLEERRGVRVVNAFFDVVATTLKRGSGA
jgi:Bacterial regulatory helix-turn-helix protein, lysR family